MAFVRSAFLHRDGFALNINVVRNFNVMLFLINLFFYSFGGIHSYTGIDMFLLVLGSAIDGVVIYQSYTLAQFKKTS